MAWLKTKKVKKCICGKEPKATIEFTDRDQARAWLMMLGTVSLFVWCVLTLWVALSEGAASPDVQSELKGAFWWFLVLAIYWLYTGYILIQIKNRGHSFKCASRLAYLKVSKK